MKQINSLKPWIVLLLVVFPLCINSGCQSTTQELTMPTDQWTLVVIGDSSVWGLGTAFAAQIEKDVGVEVVLKDFAKGNLSADDVLKELSGEGMRFDIRELPMALEDADVVVMWVNPSDSFDPEKPIDIRGCLLNSPYLPITCSPETLELFIADVESIWAKIIEISDGRPIILRAMDIYMPLVAPHKKSGLTEVCSECFVNTSNAARSAAETYAIPFLSRYDAFNGPDHLEDPREKGYIVADGEHPSDLACEFTAELLSQMGYEPVSYP